MNDKLLDSVKEAETHKVILAIGLDGIDVDMSVLVDGKIVDIDKLTDGMLVVLQSLCDAGVDTLFEKMRERKLIGNVGINLNTSLN